MFFLFLDRNKSFNWAMVSVRAIPAPWSSYVPQQHCDHCLSFCTTARNQSRAMLNTTSQTLFGLSLFMQGSSSTGAAGESIPTATLDVNVLARLKGVWEINRSTQQTDEGVTIIVIISDTQFSGS